MIPDCPIKNLYFDFGGNPVYLLDNDTRNKKSFMLQDTISSIEKTIQSSPAIKDENRAELLSLLGTLKSEIGELSKTHQEQAASITNFTELSAHEATRKARNPELLKLSAKGLGASVRGFEGTHPKLVSVVNRISTLLANMGI
jgi:hypothetical protein